MTDLSIVLPDFDTQSYIRLIPPLERNNVTVADLLTLESAEVAKRAQVPLLDVKRLSKAILETLQQDLGAVKSNDDKQSSAKLRRTGTELLEPWSTISTLDDELDQALGGGIPAGYITEITGERYIHLEGQSIVAY
jgi:DNA repair protein RAD57